MGFLNDIGVLLGFEPVYNGGVQDGNYFYCIDGSGDVYRQLNPLDGPLPSIRPWVRVDPKELPCRTRTALRLLSFEYI